MLDRLIGRRASEPLVVVSGLPRSGTSMMMQMLGAGGLDLLTDGARAADASNPAGYFELASVTRLDAASARALAVDGRGKVVKVVSPLLHHLPEPGPYRVIFMRRDLDEVLDSQDRMLERTGQGVSEGESAALKHRFAAHLDEVRAMLTRRRCFATLEVQYRDVLDDPRGAADRVARFLGTPLDVARMAAAVNPALHRSRR
jgi:ElaB/YqjD/DUF883 family membrane-anchored ribosome-binding protein